MNNYIVRSYRVVIVITNIVTKLQMGQFSNVLLAINNLHSARRRALDCGPGLDQAGIYKKCTPKD